MKKLKATIKNINTNKEKLTICKSMYLHNANTKIHWNGFTINLNHEAVKELILILRQFVYMDSETSLPIAMNHYITRFQKVQLHSETLVITPIVEKDIRINS